MSETTNSATTITVGSGSSVNITATPTISQSVELWCSRSLASKKWYITGNIVKATPGEVWTAPGHRLATPTPPPAKIQGVDITRSIYNGSVSLKI